MQRIAEMEWDTEGVLPVSFAPLINGKDEKKESPQFIEIRKLIVMFNIVLFLYPSVGAIINSFGHSQLPPPVQL